ncbi:MAG: hypothetical protein M1825_004463 [Sarcosagium campestre]|nr:MAG: hypothetical protein M1825_004463 [Sarcosagium campestre]
MNTSSMPYSNGGPEPLSPSKSTNIPAVQATRHDTTFVKNRDSSARGHDGSSRPVDSLLARLVEQESELGQQQDRLSPDGNNEIVENTVESIHSPVAATRESSPGNAVSKGTKATAELVSEPDNPQMQWFMRRLEEANNRLSRNDQEASPRRAIRIRAPSSEAAATPHASTGGSAQLANPESGRDADASTDKIETAREMEWTPSAAGRFDSFGMSVTSPQSRPALPAGNPWGPPNSGRSAAIGAQSVAPIRPLGLNPASIWNDMPPSSLPFAAPQQSQQLHNGGVWHAEPSRPWLAPGMPTSVGHPQSHLSRGFPAPYTQMYSSDARYLNQYQNQTHPMQNGRGRGFTRYDPTPSNQNWGPPAAYYQPTAHQAHAQARPMYQPPTDYLPRPIGTPLSPTAPEFTMNSGSTTPWNASSTSSPGQTYVTPVEPLNYRRLLERDATCNWKYIVDKIVCNNDQQASIFLQQKLKLGTTEQKYEIVEAIIAQAYPLMVNRFGNFLVQRCFEHGTPSQVVSIANAIRGNTLSLSMDSFGCHVVQKAFDSVPEEYKAVMVHELLRRIPETVIHRYACHVWQKLFELRWNDAPPQIMRYVNEALRGMWTEVALGETGSLVVQNIFENCLEDDKRPCLSEVLANIDTVARGQFGNWCVQHICEHGAPPDRTFAIDHVVNYAIEYSMDQFASKVVEKCLKIGGHDFLDRYLNKVCNGQRERTRIPLIDISSDQYGNYLIQYILTHSGSGQREQVASHIRRHMVSLRGSKFGSRVAMLCHNPAVTTRPGPGVGLPMGRFPGSRFGPAGFR